MKYRKLGSTGLSVSEISLGTEYLIDLPPEEAVRIIHYAMERGMNYFDLFFAQPDFRDTMGRAFRGRRNSVLLTAHLGASHRDGQYERTRDIGECDRLFHDFLHRYHTDYVDFLFLHNSDTQEDFDLITGPGHMLELALKYKEQGKVRHIAFSGHAVDTALQAIALDPVELLMFPVNMASHAVPGKQRLLEECGRKKVALVAMKPFAGGKLLQSGDRVDLVGLQSGGEEYSIHKSSPITAAQCLSYVLSRDSVNTIVPGCSSLEHIDQALAYYTNSIGGNQYSQHLVQFEQFRPGECVYCNHCLPCPAGIDIGQCLRLYDTALAAGINQEIEKSLACMDAGPGDCLACGDCEERCPFGVSTVSMLEKAADLFG